MSRTRGIGEGQDPPRKPNRSATPSPRTSTLSQTIQIITNKLRLSPASPKLRRLRRKVPYDRVNNNPQELSQVEDPSQEIIPSLDESIETEVFFKTATTTNTVYQVEHSLDDTIPYFDPLSELRRDTYTPLPPLNVNSPLLLIPGDITRTSTPPQLQITGRPLEAIAGTSADTTYADKNPIQDTTTTSVLREVEENQEEDRDVREENAYENPIDLRTRSTRLHDTTIDLREEDQYVDDWNGTDIVLIEDDRDTPYTTAHNTIIIDDSDDEHSDRSTESEQEIAGFSTPPLTPSLVVNESPSPEVPEKRSGFGNPPWARNQNIVQGDTDPPQPKATSSPRDSPPQVEKKTASTMESQQQNKGKTDSSDTITKSKHTTQEHGISDMSEMTDETVIQGMLYDRQAALPKLLEKMQSYPRMESTTLEVVLMYYRTTHNEFPLLELTRESRELLLNTLERIFTGFRGIPPQTLLLHSDLSILLYTYTLSEIAELYPLTASHMQPLYEAMIQNVELYGNKPRRYNDVHEIIATFYPPDFRDQSRVSFPSMIPDDVHHAQMRSTYELNVRTVCNALDRMVTTHQVVRDKRKLYSQANDSDTNNDDENGKKFTVLESDIDTNTGRTGQDYSTVNRFHNTTYTCEHSHGCYKDPHELNESKGLTMQELYDREHNEEKVKSECKMEVKDENIDKKLDNEQAGRSNKATDYFYDVNWRHDRIGREANSHKVPNKYSCYDLRIPRQEYVTYPVTQVPQPVAPPGQRTYGFQTIVPGNSGQADLYAPPIPTGNASNNATLAGAHHNTQRPLSRSFNLADRGPPNNNTNTRPLPNFPDLTGRNNNATPINAGVTGITGLAPLTASTPNQNANVTHTHSNLQPGDPMYNLISRLIEVQEKQTNSIVEIQFRDKKFDGSKPELAHVHLTNFKSHWSRLITRKTVQEDQYPKHFHDTLSGSAYEWFDKRKDDLTNPRQIHDAFLARYNKWGENRQTCLDEWQSLKYPWAIPMDDFLQDLTNLAYIVEVTDEHKIMTFKSSMPNEIKVHLVSCDSLSECAKTAENIINLFKRQNKIPADAYQPDKEKSNSQSQNNTEKPNDKKSEQTKDSVNLHYENDEAQKSQGESCYQHSLDERNQSTQSNEGNGGPQRNNNYRGRFQNQRGYRGGRGRGNRGQQNQYNNRSQNRDYDNNRQWRQENNSGDYSQGNRGGQRNDGSGYNNNRGYNGQRGGNRRNFENRGRGRNTQASERPSPTFDPNKYCEVCDKTGHLPNECFVVARFQRASPFISKQSVQAHKTIQQTPAQQTQPPQQGYPPMYPPYPYMYPNPQAYMMHHPPPTGLPQITQGQTGVAPQQTQAPTTPQNTTSATTSNLA